VQVAKEEVREVEPAARVLVAEVLAVAGAVLVMAVDEAAAVWVLAVVLDLILYCMYRKWFPVVQNSLSHHLYGNDSLERQSPHP